MDEYEPTIDKMGFKFQDSEATLEDIIETLKKVAPDILRQAREYREPRVDPKETPVDIAPIITKPGEAIISNPVKAPEGDEYPKPSGSSPLQPTDPSSSGVGGSVDPVREITRVVLSIDGVEWEIIVRLGFGHGENVFVHIEETKPEDKDDKEILFVTIGGQHPFVTNYWSDDREVQSLLLIMASAIGFSEIAARRAGAKLPSYVRKNIDHFLRLVVQSGRVLN